MKNYLHDCFCGADGLLCINHSIDSTWVSDLLRCTTACGHGESRKGIKCGNWKKETTTIPPVAPTSPATIVKQPERVQIVN